MGRKKGKGGGDQSQQQQESRRVPQQGQQQQQQQPQPQQPQQQQPQQQQPTAQPGEKKIGSTETPQQSIQEPVAGPSQRQKGKQRKGGKESEKGAAGDGIQQTGGDVESKWRGKKDKQKKDGGGDAYMEKQPTTLIKKSVQEGYQSQQQQFQKEKRQQEGQRQQQRQQQGPQTLQWPQQGPRTSQSQHQGSETSQWQQQELPPHIPWGLDLLRKQKSEKTPQQQQSQTSESKSTPIEKAPVGKSEYTYSPSNIPLAKGTKGRPAKIETNYLDLSISNIVEKAWQYDVTIDPDKPKKFLRRAFNEFRTKYIPTIFLAFDGQKIAFSPIKLNGDVLNQTFVVKVIGDLDKREKEFKVTLKEAIDCEIELNSLKNYKGDRIFNKPMRAVQCIDVVLRSAPSNSPKAVRAGRSFYIQPQQKISLGDGYELWYGLYQSAVLGERPLLNIDICHKAFPSEMNIIDVFNQFRDADDLLKGLQIIYTQPKILGGIKKCFKFNKIMKSSKEQTFPPEFITVEQYFRTKGYQLRSPDYPCIHVGPPDQNIYVPAELCTIAPGQAINKKIKDNQVREMIRYAATKTTERKIKIMKIFNEFNYAIDPTLRQFKLSIGRDFITIDARIINPPKIEYSRRQLVEPRQGAWRADNVQYITGSEMVEWAILITDRKMKDDIVRDFARFIIRMGRTLQMNISDNYTIEKESNIRFIDNKMKQLKSARKNLVFVVISGFDNDYSAVKQHAELQHGVLTQCIKSVTLYKRLNASTIQNILLKVNAKLNGTNHKISNSDETRIMDDAVMFIGADVTHPSPDQKTIPSVVGVAASHDLCGFKYNMRYRLQDPKKEIIDDMENVMHEQLLFYKAKNNKFPNKIIYYRDGVSDGQFEQVKREEFTAMDRACAKVAQGYKPKIVCIVVQKRHHTRFFPAPGSNLCERDKFLNVPPGTIVDTTITHPCENQFFLVSHVSIQGTAKPTKYCLLRDDAGLNIDDLQAMTYNLCHMFSRCNRAVSYPAPAYYGHLAAYRGRVYTEGSKLNIDNLQMEYRKRQIKDDIINKNPMFFV